MKQKEIKKQKKELGKSKYLNRTQAIRKLQLPISDFRKLCILKGIYPIEPKNKRKENKNSTLLRTFYNKKDIKFLQNEPVLSTLRDIKSHQKKEKKAILKNQPSVIKSLIDSKPKYKLNNIILERYPTFEDALKDLDDALATIALYANLPSTTIISTQSSQTSIKLLSDFKNLTSKLGLLSKVFLSIKGIYYQVLINEIKITWIEPYKFTQNIPVDVDFKIMNTFWEINSTLLGFVNYRLGMLYDQTLQTEVQESDENEQDETTTQNEKVTEKRLFTGLKFYLSREVPAYSLEYVIAAFGGVISDEESCTHYITERQVETKEGIVYLQPQWVYDSLNNGVLLKVSGYLVGQVLPPHLSPFVHEDSNGYRPQELNEEDEDKEDVIVTKEEQKAEEPNHEVDVVPEEPTKSSQEVFEINEELELKKMMMSRKNRKLYDKMQYGKEKKLNVVKKLQGKKALKK